jgi:hypothetical protein
MAFTVNEKAECEKTRRELAKFLEHERWRLVNVENIDAPVANTICREAALQVFNAYANPM